jgi:hypothetical protein
MIEYFCECNDLCSPKEYLEHYGKPFEIVLDSGKKLARSSLTGPAIARNYHNYVNLCINLILSQYCQFVLKLMQIFFYFRTSLANSKLPITAKLTG